MYQLICAHFMWETIGSMLKLTLSATCTYSHTSHWTRWACFIHCSLLVLDWECKYDWSENASETGEIVLLEGTPIVAADISYRLTKSESEGPEPMTSHRWQCIAGYHFNKALYNRAEKKSLRERRFGRRTPLATGVHSRHTICLCYTRHTA